MTDSVDVLITAMDIVVDNSSYPTPEIAKNASDYRQLGLGYANLGALLMARGLPYDSDEGRAYAAAITALMTGRAYRKSAEVAQRMGPHVGYAENRAAICADLRYARPVMSAVIAAAYARPSSESYGSPRAISSAPRFA